MINAESYHMKRFEIETFPTPWISSHFSLWVKWEKKSSNMFNLLNMVMTSCQKIQQFITKYLCMGCSCLCAKTRLRTPHCNFTVVRLIKPTAVSEASCSWLHQSHHCEIERFKAETGIIQKRLANAMTLNALLSVRY